MARNYGLIVSTFDERQYVLSAVTHGIRNNWITALKSASNLSNTSESDTPKKEKFDLDVPIFTRRNTTDNFMTSSTPVSRSSDESRAESSPSVPPISPPLTRTPTSRIKKDRGKSSRVSSVLKNSTSLNTFGSETGAVSIEI